jgi:hypothetical protein
LQQCILRHAGLHHQEETDAEEAACEGLSAAISFLNHVWIVLKK